MPQIPVYESQISAGPVPKSPEATADDFGAQTSKAIVGLTQAGLDLTGTVIQARRAADSNRGMADATRQIGAIAGSASDDSDPATRVDRVKQGLELLGSKYRAMADGAYRDGALGVFGSLAPTVLAIERSNAAKREAALHQEDLTADTDYYIGQAAAASNDLERQLHINFAKAAIARANAAGYISKDDALARLRVLPGRIEEQQAEALIARDAAAAERALDDPKRFRNIEPAARDLLRGQATLARQKASFAAVSAVEAGLADGSTGRADIAALYERGMIGEARRDALLKRADEAAKERAEKAEGVQRVDAALHEGGKLDPKKPKDRAAVDAHFDAVVAPGDPDQATLVAYVERVGMVPEGLVKRLKGGLASDDPQQVVNAASLIGALGKADAKLVEGLGAQRVRYSKAVTAGVDGSLTAERAVELADKSRGRPDVGDDEGAHTAHEEGSSDARDSETAKPDKDKDGSATGTSGNSPKADSSSAGTTGETVGPEIAPVDGTAERGSSRTPQREGYSGAGHGGGGGGGYSYGQPRTSDSRVRIVKNIAHATSAERLRKQFEAEYGADVYSRTGAPPPPPGMDVPSMARAGNWIGKGYGGGRTNPSFLPLTKKDEDVGPAKDMYGKVNWFDKISKPHDQGFNDAQQTLLSDLLNFDKPARQAFGDYFSALARTDRQFLEDAQEGVRDLDKFNETGKESDLGVLSKDPYLRDLFRAAVNVFEGTAVNYERLARISYEALNLHEQKDSPALADAKLRLQMFSALVDGDVVGRPVEGVLNRLRNRVIELGGNPDEVLRGRPAAYVDNPEQEDEPTYMHPDIVHEMLNSKY